MQESYMCFPSRLTQFLTYQVIMVDVYRLILPVLHSNLTHVRLISPPRFPNSTYNHHWRSVQIRLYFWVRTAAEETEKVSIRLLWNVLWNVLLPPEWSRIHHRFIIVRKIVLLRIWMLLMKLTLAMIRRRSWMVRYVGLQYY